MFLATWTRIPGERIFEFPTVEMIEAVGNLPYVRSYDFRSESSLLSRELYWAPLPIDDMLLPENVTAEELNEFFTSGALRKSGAYVEMFPVFGINNPDLTDEQAGLISLTSGRFMKKAEIVDGAPVAIVSEGFAQINGLDVGSTFILEHNVYDDSAILSEANWDADAILPFSLYHLDEFIIFRQSVEFQIVGLFTVNLPFLFPDDVQRTQEMTLRTSSLYNQIYIPHRLLEDIERTVMPYRQEPDLY